MAGLTWPATSGNDHMKSELFDLTNQTVPVIGGTSVLGGSMIDDLAACGARIGTVSQSEQRG